MLRPPECLIRKIYRSKESWVWTRKSIRLSTVQAEMYVGIIRGWAMDSEGLFSPTGVKCDFRVYQVIGERASKVICSIGSRSRHSDFIPVAIWHSIITARWPPWPYNIQIFYFANAPFSQSCPPNPPPPKGEFSSPFMADISYRGDILTSPDTCVNLMVIYPDGYMEGC